ncbi:MAG: lipid asymmetry maintenance protein MlaB [Bacteroidota bacterium]
MDPVQIEQTADKTHVTLAAMLSVAEARLLYEKLGAALMNTTAVVMDGAGVKRVDTAALQILANFCRAARERGLALAWQNPSSDLQLAAQTLGLHTLLEMNP